MCEDQFKSTVEQARALGQVELAGDLLEWEPEGLMRKE